MIVQNKVAIVTGGSSGIGFETAKALSACGIKVYEFSRRDFSYEGLIHKKVDVTIKENVESAVSEIEKTDGRIDILVNCAGSGISGAIEFTDIAEAKRQFNVNFFGMVNVCKAVLPIMRNCGSGRIVNISSVASPIPIPFQCYYSASKAAIDSYTMSLANEVRPYGITVAAVRPGDIKTGFTDARTKSSDGDKEYGGRITKSVSVMEHDERNGMDAGYAGKYICKIALKKNVKPLYAIGFSYKCVCFLGKVLPCGLLNRLIGLLYAK